MSGSIPCARSPSRMRSAVSNSLARFARTQSSRISSSSSVLGRSTGGAAAGSGGAAPSGGPVGRLHDVCLVSAWYQYVVSLYRGSLASIQPGGSGGGSSSRRRFSPVTASVVVAAASSSAGSSATGAASAVSVLASGAGAATGSASAAGSASDIEAAAQQSVGLSLHKLALRRGEKVPSLCVLEHHSRYHCLGAPCWRSLELSSETAPHVIHPGSTSRLLAAHGPASESTPAWHTRQDGRRR